MPCAVTLRAIIRSPESNVIPVVGSSRVCSVLAEVTLYPRMLLRSPAPDYSPVSAAQDGAIVTLVVVGVGE